MRTGGRTLLLGFLAVTPIVPGLSSCAGSPAPSGDGREKMTSESRALYVREAEIPRVARAGEPIEVLVRGDLPNPGWKFLRWDIRREDGAAGASSDDGAAAGTRWSVMPLIISALRPGEMVAQVLVPFEGVVRLDAQPEGAAVSIVVRGFAPEETVSGQVDILPARTLIALDVTGGFAGIHDRVTVADDGAVAASRSIDARRGTGRLAAGEMDALRAARDAARLAELPPVSRTENAADLFEYDLTDFSGDAPIRVVADDLSLPPGLAALVQLLRDKQAEILERPKR